MCYSQWGHKLSDSTEHTYMSHTLKSENQIPPVLFFLKTLEILNLVSVENVIVILIGGCAESEEELKSS